jgi:3D (Asp-Asp-Asp) domain-containing protein
MNDEADMPKPRARLAWRSPPPAISGLGMGLALVLATGCGHDASDDHLDIPAARGTIAAVAAPADLAEAAPGQLPGQPLGRFQFTYYYVAAEEDHVPANDGDGAEPSANPDSRGAAVETAAANGAAPSSDKLSDSAGGEIALTSAVPPSSLGSGATGLPDRLAENLADPANEAAVEPPVERAANDNARRSKSSRSRDSIAIFHRKRCGKPLAKVSRAFAAQLEMQGTGKLRDGRTINVSGTCGCPRSPCYFVVQRDVDWGIGVNKRPLAPFRSVAVDTSVVPIGKLLYIPELDGLTMPGRAPWGGYVHDGCVMADDVGGAIDGKQLDFFVGRRAYYNGFSRRHHLNSVHVYDGTGRCERRNGMVARVHRNAT